jgi:hypothetical protein
VAARRDLSTEQRDDLTHVVLFQDGAGLPLDVSGYVFTSQVRRRWSDETVDGEFDVDMGEAAQGTVIFTLPSAVTETLTPGKYRYDVRQSNGRLLTILKGEFVVEGEITR